MIVREPNCGIKHAPIGHYPWVIHMGKGHRLHTFTFFNEIHENMQHAPSRFLTTEDGILEIVCKGKTGSARF